jgi:hypothetical protein
MALNGVLRGAERPQRRIWRLALFVEIGESCRVTIGNERNADTVGVAVLP